MKTSAATIALLAADAFVYSPTPREAFWVNKHAIKTSAMPALGTSHDDAMICSMVAFLQKLPTLSPAQYKAIVAKAPSKTWTWICAAKTTTKTMLSRRR